MMHALNIDEVSAPVHARREPASARSLKMVRQGAQTTLNSKVNMPWQGVADSLGMLQQLVNEASGLCERMERLSDPTSTRVTAMDKGDLVVFDARHIGRFYAAGKYSGFVLDGREYLSTESLRTLETRLAPLSFMRVHRKELVNISRVVRMRRTADTGTLLLEDGQEAPVSRQLVLAVRDRLLGEGCP